MSIFSVFFIAVGLAMDACAVSVSNGIALKKVRRKDALKMALFFGLFQFFMPLVGYFLGSTVRQYIEAYDHWVAFILLALIGLNMIKEARSEKEEEQRGSIVLSAKLLTLQAIATRVSIGEECSIIIEDGYVVGQEHPVMTEPKKWKAGAF